MLLGVRVALLDDCSMTAGPDDVLLRLHGDEGPYFKKRNLLVLLLSFPHNHGVPLPHWVEGERFYLMAPVTQGYDYDTSRPL